MGCIYGRTINPKVAHDHCGDWHRCHYYFYGYKQWERWDLGKYRAYFVRRYHHR
jgi:hypothetical protein